MKRAPSQESDTEVWTIKQGDRLALSTCAPS